MVDMRDSLIDKPPDSIITQKRHHHAEHFKHRVSIEMLQRHKPSSESKALMRIKRFAGNIRREQSQQPSAVESHQREVAETVGMVVHVITIMQECGIF